MKRRDFLKTAAMSAVFPAGFAGNAQAAAQARQNAVFILVDDLGWRDLGCYGSSFYETPRIDRLAREGMRFTNAYAACPVCSPTRVSIMTGKYPARLATTDWFGAPQPETARDHHTRHKPLLPAPYVDHLPLSEKSLAAAFREGGYRTFFAGKWHLGGEGRLPENHGFDINKGGHDKGSPRSYFSPYQNPNLDDGPEGEHLPARLANECAGFLDGVKDDPFLLFFSMYTPHTPLQGREDLIRKYEAKAATVKHDGPRFLPEGAREARQVQDHAVYAAMVEAMDDAVGTVLDALESNGLAETTTVVFMSDNGGLSTSEGSPTSNVPLRAGKGWLYEGGIRVPMIIKSPGLTAPGSECHHPVTSTDFYPTLLPLAGLASRPEQHRDGINLAPLLRGDTMPGDRPLFWHYPHYGNQGGSPGAAVRKGDYKLIEFFEDGRIELYNLAEDIGEQHDLSKTIPEKAAELRGLLHAWQESVGARFPSPNPDAA